ncbi:unnamed protein product [Tilletia controversa]|nr:unnamed protein product [Tilletia controversa]
MPSLFDLPASLLVDSVLCYLGPRDLTQLAATSKYARSLADADFVWARRLVTDFHFPLDSSARPIHFSSGMGWKTIYARLSNPTVFVWGEITPDRLGQEFGALPEAFADLLWDHGDISTDGGIPFPIPVPGTDQPQKVGRAIRASSLQIGPPVQIHSTGYAFLALTSSGHVVFWGCLDRPVVLFVPEQRQKNRRKGSEEEEEEQDIPGNWQSPYASVPKPTVLPIPPSLRVNQLGVGRKHAIALAVVRSLKEEKLERAKELSNAPTSPTRSSSSVEQSKAILLEWHAWGDIVRIDPDVIGLTTRSSETSTGSVIEQTELVQVEAGWEFSAVLVHRHEHRPTHSASPTSTKKIASDIYFWLTSWQLYADRQQPGQRLASEAGSVDAACSTLPTVQPVSIQLPPLPPPPPGLLTRLERQRSQLRQSQDPTGQQQQQESTPSALDEYYGAAALGQDKEQLITKIAAGTSFLIALTSQGLVYRLELLRGHAVAPPLDDFGGELERDQERASARAFREELYSAWESGEEGDGWELLDTFCVPDEIGKCGVIATPEAEGEANNPDTDVGKDEDEGRDLKGYVDASIRITHISAHYRNFAAYSVAATSQLVGGANTAGGTEGKSIVLLGDDDSTLYPERIRRTHVAGEGPPPDARDEGEVGPPRVEPRIIPELQARSIIKVVQGDFHAGAMDAKGHVVAWGNWSHGALGVWDALPLRDGGVAPVEGDVEGGANDVEGRAKRRAAQRVCREVVERPLEVQFLDWRKNDPPRQFVFDLAMSGHHSGALAVDMDYGKADVQAGDVDDGKLRPPSLARTRLSRALPVPPEDV